jgi:Protein of unknown function (DUF3617)
MKAVLAGLLVFGLLSGAEAVELDDGNWRLHVATTINRTPEPIRDTVECLSAEELADLGAYFTPVLDEAEANCQTTRLPSAGSRRIDHRMHCVGQDLTIDTTSMVTIESSNRFHAVVRIDSRTENESARVFAEVEGSRTGVCGATGSLEKRK